MERSPNNYIVFSSIASPYNFRKDGRNNPKSRRTTKKIEQKDITTKLGLQPSPLHKTYKSWSFCEFFWDYGKSAQTPKSSEPSLPSGQVILRTGTSWRASFNFSFATAGPYDVSFVPVTFFAREKIGGTGYWYANFSSLHFLVNM